MARQLFQKATNSLFERLGQKGLYGQSEVLFILSAPDEYVDIGLARAYTPTNIIKIKIEDAPELKAGDTITAGEIVYSIMGQPKKDLHHLYWQAEAVCE